MELEEKRNIVLNWIAETTKVTWLLRGFGFTKIPMLYMCAPEVVELDEEHCVVKIPLRRRTRNHEQCMYIGALTVGADVAGGIIALYHMQDDWKKARFLFKDMTASYLKRAEGDVYFTCHDGEQLAATVEEARQTGKRMNQKVSVVATVPDKLKDQPVATFELTFSVKF